MSRQTPLNRHLVGGISQHLGPGSGRGSMVCQGGCEGRLGMGNQTGGKESRVKRCARGGGGG